ncbi:MAG: GvpL/GvpF family gas vesicle protein [Acidobacteria bacterium]|nr:GvpL/GvpF family gas vesicle protein [Acidobacteriota bacterium]
MPLYVLALTDSDLGTWTVGRRRLQSAAFGRIHVVYQRRSVVPPVTDEELRAQHAVVLAIAEQASAVLPARYGSLLSKGELAAAVRQHENEIVAALDRVRDHVQMTIRVLGTRASRPPLQALVGISGTEYLQRARRAADPPMTPTGERVLAAVRPLVAAERREHGAGGLLATIYHLVDVHKVERYTKAAGGPVPGVIVSGPWPPFAFSPQLW